MADKRKLQVEIERTLKRVTEGVEAFEEIWKKVYSATNVNQKEKYEADLKKEIKKLQRHRDQIKTWMASSDIKDKRTLAEKRKIIETQMERFKIVERETKTKAYSKEGLSGGVQKVDPIQKEKDDVNNWLAGCIDTLNIQCDQFECEIESVSLNQKKGKGGGTQSSAAGMAKIEECKHHLERHRFHIRQLETLMRMLDNGTIEVEKIKKIRDDVDYYIESCQDPDFEENEYIYADLDLDEDALVEFNTPVKGSSTSSNTSEANDSVAQMEDAIIGTTTPSAPGSAPCPTSTANSGALKSASTNHIASPPTSPTQSHKDPVKPVAIKGNVALPAQSVVIAPPPQITNSPAQTNGKSGLARNQVGSSASTSGSPSPQTTTNVPMHMPYSVAAAKVPPPQVAPVPLPPAAPSGQHDNNTTDPSSQQQQMITNGPSSLNLHESGPSLGLGVQQQQQQQQNAPSLTGAVHILNGPSSDHKLMPPVNASKGVSVIGMTPEQQQHMVDGQLNNNNNNNMSSLKTIAQHALNQQSPIIHDSSNQPTSQQANMLEVAQRQRQQLLQQQQQQQQEQQQQLLQQQQENSMAAMLQQQQQQQQQLMPSTDSNSSEVHQILPLSCISSLGTPELSKEHFRQLHLLNLAMQHLPRVTDADRIRPLLPRNPYHPIPPHYPTTLNHSDTVEFFQRLSTETLFFVFYYMEGTRAQYLAAKALKKQSWRFHTKLMMWFQRHEEPKKITDEFEHGTYIYFDYEKWSQRRREGFTFEYRYLEDKDLN